MKELTKGEEQVMQVIWSIGQGFANEIMAAFPEPKPAGVFSFSLIKMLFSTGFLTFSENRLKKVPKFCLGTFLRINSLCDRTRALLSSRFAGAFRSERR